MSTSGWTKRFVDDYLRRRFYRTPVTFLGSFNFSEKRIHPILSRRAGLRIMRRAESRVYSRENARPMDSKRWPWLTDPF